MSYQHKDLAAGRWKTLSLVEQMAHIGGEVERALSWREKGNEEYSRMAFERALELTDLTLAHLKRFSHLKEVARLREALVDYFWGANEFKSSATLWRGYFSHFTYAARRDK